MLVNNFHSVFRYASPLGEIRLSAAGEALTGLWFEGQKYEADRVYPEQAEKPLPIFEETAEWLDLYFSGKAPGFTPALNPQGTPFRRAVWEMLQRIPYGETVTYGEIAAEIAKRTGKPRMSAQAVGGAIGHNPVLILIPCHRVIGADGSLTGYAGGLNRKRTLLRLEGVNPGKLRIPANLK